MRTGIITLLLVAGMSTGLRGQDRCGSGEMPPGYAELVRITSQAAGRSDTLYQIPVVFHLVARSNGSSQTQAWRVLQALCELNEQFEATGIRFFLPEQGIRLVNQTSLFTQHYLSANQQQMRNLEADSALNIFVVQNAGPSGEQNVVGYFDAGDDWLVLRRDMLRSGNKALVHECGHFFGLLHPHYGWDAQAWTQAGPAPALSSDGITATERMDGSNCQTGGDQLCDTPPDYNVGLGWQQSCHYAGGVQDPAGTPLDPGETLIMSYFNDSCRAVFSPQQQALMRADLALPHRAYLLGQSANSDPLAGPPLLLLPADTVLLAGDSLRFTWQPMAGATHYFLETDRSAAFDLDARGLILSDTLVWLTDTWLTNQAYYWRVFAYRGGNTCAPASVPRRFVPVAASVSTEDGIAAPAFRFWQEGERLYLHIQPQRLSQQEARISDLSGRSLIRQTLTLRPGPQVLEWDLSQIAAGWYFFQLSGSKNVHFTIQIR